LPGRKEENTITFKHFLVNGNVYAIRIINAIVPHHIYEKDGAACRC
jgi:hypothetical protein